MEQRMRLERKSTDDVKGRYRMPDVSDLTS
jgi:hypothetical protein